MTNRFTFAAAPALVCAALITLATGASAQQHDPATPLAVASKVALRGEANGIAVREMRIVRKNDILVVLPLQVAGQRGQPGGRWRIVEANERARTGPADRQERGPHGCCGRFAA